MEPGFKVIGDQDILKDAKVNLEIVKDGSMSTVTIFNKGEAYAADIEGALRYHMYLSYRDSLYHAIKADNLHDKIKGVARNDIYFKRKDGNIIAVYVPFEGNEGSEGFVMQKGSAFFAEYDSTEADKIRQKFTGTFNSK